MCKNSKIISSVKIGELSVCNSCGLYSLLFNNLSFQFNKKQLLHFRTYVDNLDIDYWMDYYGSSTKKRKIPITTMHENLVLLFTEDEIETLKLLLMLKDKPKQNIPASEIDYNLILN
jgi:hypothetical protein